MNELESSRYMYQTLKKINSELNSAKISMWSTEDKYAYPPFFRFRFNNEEKTSSIYSKIASIIESYNGFLKWKIFSLDGMKNFIIIPEVFQKFSTNNRPYDKENILSKMDQAIYKTQIDFAIRDIPKLAEYILSKWE